MNTNETEKVVEGFVVVTLIFLPALSIVGVVLLFALTIAQGPPV